jgi:hypothetical protein
VFPHGPILEGGATSAWGGPGDQVRQPPGRAASRWPLVIVTLAVALIVGAVAVAATVAIDSRSKAAAPASGPATPLPTPGTTAPGPAPTPPAGPADPGQSALSALVVTQSDVASADTVGPIPNGDQVIGQPSLDLCNGTFPSEAFRKARLQVVAVNGQGTSFLSTEAVLYASAANTSQAFAELKARAATCPASPVPSPVGEPTVTTRFNPAPDGAWPQTPTVERLAFDFVTTDDTGQAHHSVAVYLRRGRALMGVYFPQPDGTQGPVAGQTSLAAIVTVFAGRMAQLPASVVNGG